MSSSIEPPKQPIVHARQPQPGARDEGGSWLRRYREQAVGNSNLLSLIRYEVITTVCGYLPGALGLVLRRQMFPQLLAWTGRGTDFGRSITLRHPHRVGIGSQSVIDDYVVLDASGTANRGIVLGDHVNIGRNTVLRCSGGDVTVGNHTSIGVNCLIQSFGNVRIGSNVRIADYCCVVCSADLPTSSTDTPAALREQAGCGLVIEDDVWIGAGTLIQDGVTIGRGAIVGSSAVVMRDIPPVSTGAEA
jgi:acetyltransferase-like isoleucine patch superfamily enzyme